MTELVASELAVHRSSKRILQNVGFQAKSGEFIAVVGANGAGKSTMLAVIAGLLTPDLGRVMLDGYGLALLKRGEIARRRAYLPQNPRCEWPISVERLVALGLTPTLPAFGGLAPRLRGQVDAMLAEWDLLDMREQAATTLSGGELARAMLARALVGDPDILIADEPISGLDPRHALDTAARLRALAHRGKLVIASVHDLTLAARHATRILALDRGRVVADGPPEQILTPEMLRAVFEVEACIAGSNGGVFVDYLAPLHPRTTLSQATSHEF